MQRSLCAAWLIACLGLASAAEVQFDLGAARTNSLPEGFKSVLGGTGEPAQWRVILDEAPTAFPAIAPGAPVERRPVLAQLSTDKTDERFPMLVYDREEFRDFKFTTRFKLVSGEAEQMAGIAFRIQDAKNYYYIRASGLGDSFYFYKVVDGVRSKPIGTNNVKLTRGVWHELAVECRGSQIRTWLNGTPYIPELGDLTFNRGKVGLWTKSDSVTYFCDMTLTYTPLESLAAVLVRETMSRYDRLRLLEIYATPPGESGVKVIASSDTATLGKAASPEIRAAIERELVYHGKSSGTITVVMPLHDRNGDPVAAVRLVMKAFPGQTQKNAVERAAPIIHSMAARIQSSKDLLQ